MEDSFIEWEEKQQLIGLKKSNNNIDEIDSNKIKK